MIHKTAIISSSANISEKAEIGPYSVIGDGVSIGEGTVIGPYVHIECNTSIGKNNRIFQSASIGGEPQDKGFRGQKTHVSIGDGNIIREFTTIHRATKEETATTLGNGNYLMAYAHMGHDVKVGNDNIICNGVGLSGHVEVGNKAVISAYVGIHQFSRIGSMVMIGALSRINQDVLPYTLVEGNPAVTHGLNVVGLRRNGMDSDKRQTLKKAYKILCREGLSVERALEKIGASMDATDEVLILMDFVKNSKRGFIR